MKDSPCVEDAFCCLLGSIVVRDSVFRDNYAWRGSSISAESPRYLLVQDTEFEAGPPSARAAGVGGPALPRIAEARAESRGAEQIWTIGAKMEVRTQVWTRGAKMEVRTCAQWPCAPGHQCSSDGNSLRCTPCGTLPVLNGSLVSDDGPPTRPNRVLVCAPRTLNATGQSRFTPSLR